MSPEEKKLITFVRRLYDKTKSGDVPWEPGSDPNLFALSLPSYNVAIERVPPSEEGPEALGLRITRDDQVPIAELSDFEAKELGFAEMRLFFDVVRKVALNLNEALDELSQELEDLIRQ